MGGTVAELQTRMGYGEFIEWQAFYASEPWGEGRDDLLAAMQMALLANVNRNAKKRQKPYEVQDFMPDFWDERSSPRRLEAKMRDVASQMRGAATQETSETNGRA